MVNNYLISQFRVPLTLKEPNPLKKCYCDDKIIWPYNDTLLDFNVKKLLTSTRYQIYIQTNMSTFCINILH